MTTIALNRTPGRPLVVTVATSDLARVRAAPDPEALDYPQDAYLAAMRDYAAEFGYDVTFVAEGPRQRERGYSIYWERMTLTDDERICDIGELDDADNLEDTFYGFGFVYDGARHAAAAECTRLVAAAYLALAHQSS